VIILAVPLDPCNWYLRKDKADACTNTLNELVPSLRRGQLSLAPRHIQVKPVAPWDSPLQITNCDLHLHDTPNELVPSFTPLDSPLTNCEPDLHDTLNELVPSVTPFHTPLTNHDPPLMNHDTPNGKHAWGICKFFEGLQSRFTRNWGMTKLPFTPSMERVPGASVILKVMFFLPASLVFIGYCRGSYGRIFDFLSHRFKPLPP